MGFLVIGGLAFAMFVVIAAVAADSRPLRKWRDPRLPELDAWLRAGAERTATAARDWAVRRGFTRTSHDTFVGTLGGHELRLQLVGRHAWVSIVVPESPRPFGFVPGTPVDDRSATGSRDFDADTSITGDPLMAVAALSPELVDRLLALRNTGEIRFVASRLTASLPNRVAEDMPRLLDQLSSQLIAAAPAFAVEDPVAVLVERTRSRAPDSARAAAVNALCLYAGTRAETHDACAALLDDSANAVRSAAARGLLGVDAPDHLPRAIAAALTSHDRGLVVDVLRRVALEGRGEHRREVEGLVKHANGVIAREAVETLGSIAGPETESFLVDALANPRLRVSAARALAPCGGIASLKPLEVARAESADPEFERAAVYALRAIRGRIVLPEAGSLSPALAPPEEGALSEVHEGGLAIVRPERERN